MVALVRDAEASRWHGLESTLVDGSPTRFAAAVRAVVESLERFLDVGKLGVDLVEYGQVLLPFERVAGRIRRMLIEMRELGRTVFFRLVVQVLALDRIPHSTEPLLLLGEVTAGGIGVHADSVRPGRKCSRSSRGIHVGVEGVEPSRIRLKGGRSASELHPRRGRVRPDRPVPNTSFVAPDALSHTGQLRSVRPVGGRQRGW